MSTLTSTVTAADFAARSCDDGPRRQVSIHRRPDRARLGPISPTLPGLLLAAFAEGYGPAWTDELTIDDPDGNRLELVADDPPITGRLIDLEGRPLPDVTVRVVQVDATPRGPFAVASTRLKRIRSGYQSFNHVHEVVAGQPLDVDSTGQRPAPTDDSSSEVPAASGSSRS